MSFLRPELAAWLTRWREALVWAALLGFGAVFALRGAIALAPVPVIAGLLLAGAGAALLRAAMRRMRLGAEAPGAGVVAIDEGRIGYLGPFGGGFVDLSALVRVEVGGRAWVLTAEDGTRLRIPFGAEGAEGMAEALSPLPGIALDRALETRRGAGVVPVWERAPAARPRLG